MKRKRFLYNGIYISAVAFLNILLNYNNRFMGLYMDDLSCWTLFQEQGLLNLFGIQMPINLGLLQMA